MKKVSALFIVLCLAMLAQTPVPKNKALRATVAPHANTLTWSWTQTSGDPATGFHVYKSATAGTQGTLAGSTSLTTLTFVDNSVAAGQTNFYQVTAYNSGGESALSNQVTCVTPFQAPGPAPTLSGAVN